MNLFYDYINASGIGFAESYANNLSGPRKNFNK